MISRPLIFGMVHLRALPGTPKSSLKVQEICDKALEEAFLLFNKNVDGIIIENMHDVPYQRPDQRGPETTAIMTKVGAEIRRNFPDSTIGAQILSCGNKEALSVALAADLDFIRCESFVFGHIGDEGFTQSDSAELLRYRKNIGAENVKIFSDLKKKHSSHAITSDISIGDAAVAANFFLTDGVIVTGAHTGCPADLNDLEEVRKVIDKPVFIGSGVTAENVGMYRNANGLIIGTAFKFDGKWQNEIDPNRVERITSYFS